MALPNVQIPILNNQLGRVTPAEDRVAGIILSGVAVTGQFALNAPFQIFSLADAVNKGINAAYDTTNTTDVYKQIREFYEQAGNGRELWVNVIPKTTTMESACDVASDIAKKLLNTASGRISMWGIARTPDSGYEPTYTPGFDTDADAAITKAHALCESFATVHKPCRALVGCRDFQGVPANLKNYRQNTTNRVGAVLFATSNTYNSAAYRNASVGFVLGRFMRNQVMRNIGRVKDGDIGLLNAFFTNEQVVETFETAWDSIHDKGYIFARKFYGKSGYFFNDDPSCSPLSDDYSSLARGRVIDKAHRIAYITFVDELLDDLETDEDGYPLPAVLKNYQNRIESAIRLQMIDQPDEVEISGVRCLINPSQQIAVTDEIKIEKLAIRPKGYSKYIEVPLGFEVSSNS